MENNRLAPIALFAYKRLDHLKATVDALKNNMEAAWSDLYVYSDAPRNEGDSADVFSVREYLRQINGFRSINILEREKNWGLADSIVDGVTKLTKEFGRVIVLEDDIIVGPGFLHFMNDALNIYADSEKVMHVSAYSYPVNPPLPDGSSSYFLRVPVCWGWATWDRAWRLYRRDLAFGDVFSARMKSEINFSGSFNFWKQFEYNKKGKLKTWFIFWYMTVYEKKGLALFPAESLAENIGHDGTGENCNASDSYLTAATTKNISIIYEEPSESPEIVDAHRRYFNNIRGPLYVRVLRKFGF